MEYWEVVAALRAVSIADKFSPTEVSNWRFFCRQYSKTFATPLHQVYDMDPESVILAVLEDGIDDVNLDDRAEELLEMILAIEDPEYEYTKQKELEEIDRQMELEEEERIRLNKPIHPALKSLLPDAPPSKKEEPKQVPQEPPPDLPKSGGINLSYLAQHDSEDGGFDE